MRLRIQTFINNEFRISVQTDNLQPKKVSDGAKEKRNTRYATSLQKIQYLDNSLGKLLSESPEYIKEKIYESTQLGLIAGCTKDNVILQEIAVLPKTYKSLTQLPDGRFVVKNASTDELIRERQRHLDIISESQRTVKKHSSYGEKQRPKVFSKLARHRLLEAGAAIDSLGLKNSSSLLTLTLPGGTPEAKEALADWSGWIVNRQTQYLRRHPVLRNCHWFFVWEWQQRGALHQHWCISAPTYELAEQASLKLKDVWYLCLKELSLKLGIDMFLKEGRKKSWKDSPDSWVWNEQRVKKSVAAYFAKYASKEVAYSEKQKAKTKRKVHFPSRWFGSSKNIKEACKAYRRDYSLHNITENEANYLRELLIAELEKYTITQRFQYEFEATIEGAKSRVTYQKEVDKSIGELNKVYELKSKKEDFKQCYCYGSTKILYVDPSKFIGAFSTFDGWFSSLGCGIHPKSAFHWELQLAREKLAFRHNVMPSFEPKYGYQNVVR